MGDLMFSFLRWFESISWFVPFEENYYLSAGIYAAHYFSFFVLVGTIAVVDLRLLGLAGQGRAVTQLAEQLFPWAWTGFGIAVLSGFIMFAPDATTFLPAAWFWIKLLAVLLAAVFTLIIQWNMRKWERAPAIPWLAKLTAFISLALWLGVILAGTAFTNYY